MLAVEVVILRIEEQERVGANRQSVVAICIHFANSTFCGSSQVADYCKLERISLGCTLVYVELVYNKNYYFR